MRRFRCCKMAELVKDQVAIAANEDDLDRILSNSNAILDKLDGGASIQCNGTSTVDLTDINSANNSGRVTPAISNSALVNPCTTPTCIATVVAGAGPVIVPAGVSPAPIAPSQNTVQAVRGLMPPHRLIQPPPLCGAATAVVNGRPINTAAHPSSLVTMLMRPSASGAGTASPQLRAGAVRSPGVPVSSVQVVNVGVANRSEQGTPRLVAVTSGVIPSGVRFIQSSPQQQQQVVFITCSVLVVVFSVGFMDGLCYNEIGNLRISTINIAIMRSRFMIGQLGCTNNPFCMISREQGVLK